MSTPPKPAFAGLNLADDLKEFEGEPAPSPRPKPNPAVLAAVSAQAGFPSREPQAAKPPPPVRELKYETRMTLRVTERDKRRFDDLSYRLRVANGEAFGRLLDVFEAQEASSK